MNEGRIQQLQRGSEPGRMWAEKGKQKKKKETSKFERTHNFWIYPDRNIFYEDEKTFSRFHLEKQIQIGNSFRQGITITQKWN